MAILSTKHLVFKTIADTAMVNINLGKIIHLCHIINFHLQSINGAQYSQEFERNIGAQKTYHELIGFLRVYATQLRMMTRES